jgi:hypothetical protein
MTSVTLILEGARGKKYRLALSQNDRDLGGGVVYRLQEQRTSKRLGTSWHDVAGCIEPTNDPGSRILADWLTTPIPVRGEINPLGGL